ncbi:hypothetical protein [Streptomyces sp. NPDC097619]|uniref:hypothetical protein n=1 Tax=Streptomyces sp. NPDC097619 TaxID=3157228 RepID=UPI00331A59C4
MSAPSAVPPARPRWKRPVGALTSWGGRRRRAATGHFLRGLAYGTGTALAGLVGYWLRQFL